jgi:hypothetical protein
MLPARDEMVELAVQVANDNSEQTKKEETEMTEHHQTVEAGTAPIEETFYCSAQARVASEEISVGDFVGIKGTFKLNGVRYYILTDTVDKDLKIHPIKKVIYSEKNLKRFCY